jgi:kinesin family member C1
MRGELKQVRDDRDRQLSQAQSLNAEFMKLKESRENSCIELDSLTLKANELEVGFYTWFPSIKYHTILLLESWQDEFLSQEKSSLKENQIKALQEKLAAAEKKLQVITTFFWQNCCVLLDIKTTCVFCKI